MDEVEKPDVNETEPSTLRYWRADPIQPAAIVRPAISEEERQAVAQINDGLAAAEEGLRTLVERGWSQARIATAVGKSQPTISRWLAELGIETAGTKRGHGGYRPSLIQDESTAVWLPTMTDDEARARYGIPQLPSLTPDEAGQLRAKAKVEGRALTAEEVNALTTSDLVFGPDPVWEWDGPEKPKAKSGGPEKPKAKPTAASVPRLHLQVTDVEEDSRLADFGLRIQGELLTPDGAFVARLPERSGVSSFRVTLVFDDPDGLIAPENENAP